MSRLELPAASAFSRVYPLPCLIQGQGAPLLLVHGSLCDARYWMPQLPVLAQTRRVIAPSLRHYYPQSYPQSHNIGAWPKLDWQRDVDDLAALIAALPERCADVVAHSRGGFIACQLALRHPERVRKLILAEPGGMLPGDMLPGSPLDHQARRRAELSALLAEGRSVEAVQRFVDGVSQPGAWRFSPAAFRRIALDNAHTLPGQLDDPLPAYESDALRGLRMPVLLVYGQRTRARFKTIIELLAQHIDHAQVQEIAAAAHGMNLAHPRAFNDAVLAFLRAR